MKILVACECYGKVRRAFRALGHDAYSCDLSPSKDGEEIYHLQGDVMNALYDEWDMLIGFPPCTDLSSSGAAWFVGKRADGRQQEAIALFMSLAQANVKKICIENPVGIMSTLYRKPDQIIEPWQFGHDERKMTCLWLKNLPPLKPTLFKPGFESRIHKMPPSKDRGILRSETYQGIADAMADQWGRN